MPKVYILSETGNEELGEEVMDLLKASRGPLSYQTRSLKIEEVSHSYMEFEELFSICEDFRIKNTKSVKPDDFVILLSPKPNIKNWFSAPDFKNNIFVHADGWDDYCKQQPKFPIAHEIISNIVQSKLFENNEELLKSVHYESLGCINDYCRLNEHVIKKLRKGTVCAACGEKIRLTPLDSRGFWDQINLTLHSISGAFKLLTRILDQEPSRIEVNGENELKFIDYDNQELILSASQKVLYILFLKHKDGLKYADFPEMKEELMELYFKHVFINLDRFDIETTISNLCDPDPDNNALSIAKSKVNSQLDVTLGPSVAVHYKILNNPETRVHSIDLPSKYRVFKD